MQYKMFLDEKYINFSIKKMNFDELRLDEIRGKRNIDEINFRSQKRNVTDIRLRVETLRIAQDRTHKFLASNHSDLKSLIYGLFFLIGITLVAVLAFGIAIIVRQ